MKSLVLYLIFRGNCREALEFYKTCLGGEMTYLKTFKESPLEVTSENESLIFDSEFVSEKITIKASDSLPENNIKIGSNFSLFVTFDTIEELQTVYDNLSKDGNVIIPLPKTSGTSIFGMLIDKFNIQWMLTLRS